MPFAFRLPNGRFALAVRPPHWPSLTQHHSDLQGSRGILLVTPNLLEHDGRRAASDPADSIAASSNFWRPFHELDQVGPHLQANLCRCSTSAATLPKCDDADCRQRARAGCALINPYAPGGSSGRFASEVGLGDWPQVLAGESLRFRLASATVLELRRGAVLHGWCCAQVGSCGPEPFWPGPSHWAPAAKPTRHVPGGPVLVEFGALGPDPGRLLKLPLPSGAGGPSPAPRRSTTELPRKACPRLGARDRSTGSSSAATARAPAACWVAPRGGRVRST